jgi:hypothetical protein
MGAMAELIKCTKHGWPPGEHKEYFNGRCIWCLLEENAALRADLAAAVDTIRRIATSYDVDAMAEARAFLKRMEVTP